MMKIYLARNNVQAGPYNLHELNVMLASGEVLLDDLMWHSGMANWQKIGEMTGGQAYYQPAVPQGNAVQNSHVQSHTQNHAHNEQRGFGDNVDFQAGRQSDEQKRVSVAELYGRKPEADKVLKPIATPSLTKPVHSAGVEYASVGSRFLALAINMTLFIVAFMPFVSGLMKLNPDQQKMTTGTFEARMAYAQTLAEQLPSQVITMTLMLLGGFVLIQLLLIVMRGQSFGKLVMGIRVVDEKTGKLPSFMSLVGVRTLLLVVIYWAVSALPFNLAFVLVGINYFMASGHSKKQGWHDRLAKTVVVKANPSQLDKTTKNS